MSQDVYKEPPENSTSSLPSSQTQSQLNEKLKSNKRQNKQLEKIRKLNNTLAIINDKNRKADKALAEKAQRYNDINLSIEKSDAEIKSLTASLKNIDVEGRKVSDIKLEKQQIKQKLDALKNQIKIDRKTRKHDLAEYKKAQKSQNTLLQKSNQKRTSILEAKKKITHNNPDISASVETAPKDHTPTSHMTDTKKSIKTAEMKADLKVATAAYKKKKAEAKITQKDYNKKVTKLAQKTSALAKAAAKEAPLKYKIQQTKAKLANNIQLYNDTKKTLEVHQGDIKQYEDARELLRQKLLSDETRNVKALLKQDKMLQKQISNTQKLADATEKKIAQYAANEEKLNTKLTKQQSELRVVQERKGFFSKGSDRHKKEVDNARKELQNNPITQRIAKEQAARMARLQQDFAQFIPPNGNDAYTAPNAADRPRQMIRTGPIQDVIQSSMDYIQSVKWPDGQPRAVQQVLIEKAQNVQKCLSNPPTQDMTKSQQLKADYAILFSEVHKHYAAYHTAWKNHYSKIKEDYLEMGRVNPELLNWCTQWEKHAEKNAQIATGYANVHMQQHSRGISNPASLAGQQKPAPSNPSVASPSFIDTTIAKKITPEIQTDLFTTAQDEINEAAQKSKIASPAPEVSTPALPGSRDASTSQPSVEQQVKAVRTSLTTHGSVTSNSNGSPSPIPRQNQHQPIAASGLI